MEFAVHAWRGHGGHKFSGFVSHIDPFYTPTTAYACTVFGT